MKLSELTATTIVAATLIGTAACGYDDYNGPPYVVGHYTCSSPVTGMPDYCELLSDGMYQVVPYDIYDSAPYGAVLNYSNRHYTIVRTSYTRVGVAPDVNYSSYRSARRASATSYSGMSSRNSRGVVVYGSSTGSRSYRSGGTPVYRSSGSHH